MMRLWFLDLLADLGLNITADTAILDFGCGSGKIVKSLLDHGYNALGCDFEYKPGPHVEFLRNFNYVQKINRDPYQLPYPNDTFDVIVSFEVMEHVQNYDETITEMRRILRPGGVCLHMFPSRLRPIESHVYVPFSSVIRNYPYLLTWALLGVRKANQSGLSARAIASKNKIYLDTSTNYLSGRAIRNAFQSNGFVKVSYVEALYLKNSPNKRGLLLFKLGSMAPPLFAIYRIFWARVLLAS